MGIELEGETLESVLLRERGAFLEPRTPRTLAQAAAILEPVATALARAHCKGLAHRDLKPANILVVGEPRGQNRALKLLHFGTAGVGPADARGFTPMYGAPEQFSSSYGVSGPWTDVFALALILVELVTDHPPFGHASADELLRALVDPLRRPTPRAHGVAVSDAVDGVFAQGLAVFPAERLQTAGAFWAALVRAMAAVDVPPRGGTPQPSRSAPGCPPNGAGSVLA